MSGSRTIENCRVMICSIHSWVRTRSTSIRCAQSRKHQTASIQLSQHRLWAEHKNGRSTVFEPNTKTAAVLKPNVYSSMLWTCQLASDDFEEHVDRVSVKAWANIVLYCIVLYSIVLYLILLYCIVLYISHPYGGTVNFQILLDMQLTMHEPPKRSILPSRNAVYLWELLG